MDSNVSAYRTPVDKRDFHVTPCRVCTVSTVILSQLQLLDCYLRITITGLLFEKSVKKGINVILCMWKHRVRFTLFKFLAKITLQIFRGSSSVTDHKNEND